MAWSLAESCCGFSIWPLCLGLAYEHQFGSCLRLISAQTCCTSIRLDFVALRVCRRAFDSPRSGSWMRQGGLVAGRSLKKPTSIRPMLGIAPTIPPEVSRENRDLIFQENGKRFTFALIHNKRRRALIPTAAINHSEHQASAHGICRLFLQDQAPDTGYLAFLHLITLQLVSSHK
jgi:hypothetical protein